MPQFIAASLKAE